MSGRCSWPRFNVCRAAGGRVGNGTDDPSPPETLIQWDEWTDPRRPKYSSRLMRKPPIRQPTSRVATLICFELNRSICGGLLLNLVDWSKIDMLFQGAWRFRAILGAAPAPTVGWGCGCAGGCGRRCSCTPLGSSAATPSRTSSGASSATRGRTPRMPPSGIVQSKEAH